jgi:F5/8 type C domain/Glycosyl hydrolases family 43
MPSAATSAPDAGGSAGSAGTAAEPAAGSGGSAGSAGMSPSADRASRADAGSSTAGGRPPASISSNPSDGMDAATSAPDAGLPAPDAATPAGETVTIRNGGFWNDASGKRIEPHGGGFLQVGDTWYWFGEDKSANGAGFKAVNCYASKNLGEWTFRKAIITRSTAPELDTADRIIERPKVTYNESTKQYVMWLHWEGRNYAEAKAGVFTSDQVDGDYAYRNAFQPNGNMSRDDTLFRDDDGKAYFLSAANENADLILYELSADYLTIARQVAVLFQGMKREAPALFKDRGRYYLITSAATGWDPNQAKYATAMSIGGPWSALQNLADATTYDTQSTYVIPVRGTARTTYVYAGDRWQDPDLGSSKYIWLPLQVSDDGHLTLDYYPEWQLDAAAGTWSVEDGFLPQTGWKLVRADSEETSAENGRASRAFDGSASTFWHTQYTGGEVQPPHELVIDLGATYQLDGFRYTPRQDGQDHGNVGDYAFYVSDAADRWAMPVAMGTFDAGSAAKLVRFTPAVGRYVRFVATREIGGRAWTNVAELDLSGKPQ